MQRTYVPIFIVSLLLAFMIPPACSTFSPPAPTSTHQPTSTDTATPTETLVPTRTPRPTKTPDLAATQQYEAYRAELQSYYDQGYVNTTEGTFKAIDDFFLEWAQLDWYQWRNVGWTTADFFVSAHLKWSSAYRTAGDSGCGYVFGLNDGGHYALFLDRSKLVFLDADSSYGDYAHDLGLTSGTGRVKFDNPFDHPVEADLTLIVTDHIAYVLVNNEMIGRYTLAQSRILKGQLALTVLSGTNRDYGTRCSMTNVHVFQPK